MVVFVVFLWLCGGVLVVVWWCFCVGIFCGGGGVFVFVFLVVVVVFFFLWCGGVCVVVFV